jgi:predicted glycoside hydrolase/deacetylase ChbG (UPF0249 family)
VALTPERLRGVWSEMQVTIPAASRAPPLQRQRRRQQQGAAQKARPAQEAQCGLGADLSITDVARSWRAWHRRRNKAGHHPSYSDDHHHHRHRHSQKHTLAREIYEMAPLGVAEPVPRTPAPTALEIDYDNKAAAAAAAAGGADGHGESPPRAVAAVARSMAVIGEELLQLLMHRVPRASSC